MSTSIVRAGFLVLGLVGLCAMVEQPLLAREAPAVSGPSNEDAWTQVRSLKARFLDEREGGDQAAVVGSYKDAVKSYRTMKDVLGKERVILEKLIVSASEGKEMSRVRRELDNNSARISEVKEVLKILDLAIGDPY